MPADHDRHFRLVAEGTQHMVLAAFGESDQDGTLVVVLCRRLPRRIGVGDDGAILAQGEHLAVADILFLEDGSLLDGVVHVLLLEKAFAYFGTDFGNLLFREVLLPGRVAVFVEHVDDGVVETGAFGDVAEHGVLADAVAHQHETASACVHRSVECGEAPIGDLLHAGGIEHQFVVVDVVDDDVVDTAARFLDATGRLAATKGNEHGSVGGGETPVAPNAFSLAYAEVGFVEFV